MLLTTYHLIKSRHRVQMGQSVRKTNTYTAYLRALYAHRDVSSHIAVVIHVQVVNMEVIHMFVSAEVQWKHIL